MSDREMAATGNNLHPLEVGQRVRVAIGVADWPATVVGYWHGEPRIEMDNGTRMTVERWRLRIVAGGDVASREAATVRNGGESLPVIRFEPRRYPMHARMQIYAAEWEFMRATTAAEIERADRQMAKAMLDEDTMREGCE